MSTFGAEYKQFFESPAGISLLNWLRDQRNTEHDFAEAVPVQAPYHASTAKAYSQLIQHIDSMMVGVVKPNRSSSGEGT